MIDAHAAPVPWKICHGNVHILARVVDVHENNPRGKVPSPLRYLSEDHSFGRRLRLHYLLPEFSVYLCRMIILENRDYDVFASL